MVSDQTDDDKRGFDVKIGALRTILILWKGNFQGKGTIVADALTESPPVQFDTSFELKEIIKLPPIAEIHGMPDFVAGVIHHDGRKIPVVDLNLKLGLGATRCEEDTRILVVQLHETEVGLLADEIKLK